MTILKIYGGYVLVKTCWGLIDLMFSKKSNNVSGSGKNIKIDGTITSDTYLPFKKLFENAVKTSELERQGRSRWWSTASTPGPITIELTSYGGCATTTLMIANLISCSPERVICEVKDYAFSGGAVIALVCDEIKMTSSAVIGQIDPQITVDSTILGGGRTFATRDYPDVLREAVKDSGTIRHSVHDAYVGHTSQQYHEYYSSMVRKLLNRKHPQEQVDAIIALFLDKKLPHSAFYTMADISGVVPYITVKTV